MAKILSGWYGNIPYKVITKRYKKLVDDKTYRVCILEPLIENDNFKWAIENPGYYSKGTIYVPIAQFNKLFKVDNTLILLYDNIDE